MTPLPWAPPERAGARVSTISDVYARAPALGLTEGQAHWLAELLLRFPGTTFGVDGAILQLSIPGRASTWIVTDTVPATMPFDPGSADLE